MAKSDLVKNRPEIVKNRPKTDRKAPARGDKSRPRADDISPPQTASSRPSKHQVTGRPSIHQVTNRPSIHQVTGRPSKHQVTSRPRRVTRSPARAPGSGHSGGFRVLRALRSPPSASARGLGLRVGDTSRVTRHYDVLTVDLSLRRIDGRFVPTTD